MLCVTGAHRCEWTAGAAKGERRGSGLKSTSARPAQNLFIIFVVQFCSVPNCGEIKLLFCRYKSSVVSREGRPMSESGTEEDRREVAGGGRESGQWRVDERREKESTRWARVGGFERGEGRGEERGRQSGMVRFKSPQMNIYIFHWITLSGRHNTREIEIYSINYFIERRHG